MNERPPKPRRWIERIRIKDGPMDIAYRIPEIGFETYVLRTWGYDPRPSDVIMREEQVTLWWHMMFMDNLNMGPVE